MLSARPHGSWGTVGTAGWWAGISGCPRALLEVPSRTESGATSLPLALLGSQGFLQTLPDKIKGSARPSGMAVGSQSCPCDTSLCWSDLSLRHSCQHHVSLPPWHGGGGRRGPGAPQPHGEETQGGPGRGQVRTGRRARRSCGGGRGCAAEGGLRAAPCKGEVGRLVLLRRRRAGGEAGQEQLG